MLQTYVPGKENFPTIKHVIQSHCICFKMMCLERSQDIVFTCDLEFEVHLQYIRTNSCFAPYVALSSASSQILQDIFAFHEVVDILLKSIVFLWDALAAGRQRVYYDMKARFEHVSSRCCAMTR